MIPGKLYQRIGYSSITRLYKLNSYFLIEQLKETEIIICLGYGERVSTILTSGGVLGEITFYPDCWEEAQNDSR